MYRSLYFKIILIFVMFMITVMAVVGTVLINSVYGFYTKDFKTQLDNYFYADMRDELTRALLLDEWASEQKNILKAYSTYLGIDVYRNYYVLDADGEYIEGSNEELGKALVKTPNMISAMAGKDSSAQLLGSDYTDYAVYLENDGRSCIIYIKDTQEEMQELSWQLFSIVLQSVMFGIIISVILSFFLAKAITGPIRNLTYGVQMIKSGRFNHIDVHSHDEIGTLTSSFNDMGRILQQTLDEVSGERMKLATVFSYLKDAVIAFREDGRVLNINKSAEKLFAGVYDDTFTSTKMFRAMNAEYACSYVSSIKQDSGYVLRDIEYGGFVLDINLGYLRYIDGNATRTGCIVVMHDITDRYELDKSQREFIANVQHELRTPLTAILGATESITLTPDMDPEMRDYFLNMITEVGGHMMHILDDLRILSRFDNNKIQWQITRFDIAHTLVHVCDIMRAVAQSHGHTINLDTGEGEIYITGDSERIEQVLINIISNSIKYTPENGRIDVRAVRGNDMVKIFVRDNGVGIPQEDLSRLFERFYRVEKSRTSEAGGTGLGLAISKEIIDAHGGSIAIRSKVGAGTIVAITLPVATKLLPDSEVGNE